MIHTSTQLKALVRNMSKGNSTQAQIIIRNYMMERFLERLSQSKYRDNFILKGGTLVSAMVGLAMRSTLDIDTTIRGFPLTVDKVTDIVGEIISIHLEDEVEFQITRTSEIMDEAEYPGIRVMMEATLDTMKTPLKLDISTGDVITPREVSYQFKLMFEDRAISVWAYNVETVLAEKLETILSRGRANTRMRDFYDLHILQHDLSAAFDAEHLRAAFTATCVKRGTKFPYEEGTLILQEICQSKDMKKQWSSYQRKYAYAADIAWEIVMGSVTDLYRTAGANQTGR